MIGKKMEENEKKLVMVMLHEIDDEMKIREHDCTGQCNQCCYRRFEPPWFNGRTGISHT
jgi:hypothetical protein